jgi:hypothetical protein
MRLHHLDQKLFEPCFRIIFGIWKYINQRTYDLVLTFNRNFQALNFSTLADKNTADISTMWSRIALREDMDKKMFEVSWSVLTVFERGQREASSGAVQAYLS